jgi:hypothetical protein
MSQPIDATAAEEGPAQAATPTAGWKLVEDALAPDPPQPRDRAGVQRGMALILMGGGLFWGAVAAAIWFAAR